MFRSKYKSKTDTKHFQQKSIDISQLMEEFSSFSNENGVFEQTFQESYVMLANRFKATFSEDPFNIIIEKTSTFNDAYDLVQRHSRFECSNVESFLYMANAYSLRASALGMMLHGGIVEETAKYLTGLNFKFAQNMTFHNREFQETSVAASYALIKTIDSRINIDGLQKYMQCAISNNNEINFPYQSYHFIEWDNILQFFDYASTIPAVTHEILEEFIYDNKIPNIIMRKELFGDDWKNVVFDD